MLQRHLLIALTAAVTLVTPALSSPAFATCWLSCHPPIVKPGPSPLPSAMQGPRVDVACDGQAPVQSIPDIGIGCPPEHAWTCCSPPGGPVCCTPPDGGSPVCSGGGGLEPEPIEATLVDVEVDSASIRESAAEEEILECRADGVESTVASVLVQLLALLA